MIGAAQRPGPPSRHEPGSAVASDTVPCGPCLRRAWLLAALAGRIEVARREGAGRLKLLLALDDSALMRGVRADSAAIAAYRRFDRADALAACERAGLAAVCRHDARYPAALRPLEDAPAVLFVAGSLARFAELTAEDRPAVGVVGARRASAYGLAVARSLGRGLAAAGVTVVSGLALGVDAAAHGGAVDAAGPTIAVLAGGAERPYPASKRRLYTEVRALGSVISEMPPGSRAFRWCFPARNRIIAGLGRLVVVVEAAERSGSLITADFARDLGRDVGAVPGQVTMSQAAGTNALLADGAHLIRGPHDALDVACGVGCWSTGPPAARLPAHLAALLESVAGGRDTLDALAADGHEVAPAIAGLAELEMLGEVFRTAGGRYVPRVR